MTGLCQCGCLKPTPIAKMTNTRKGHVAGQPTPFLKAHGLHRPCARPDEDQPGRTWKLSLHNKGEVVAYARLDREDWPLVAGRHWSVSQYGYARARDEQGRELFLHRLVMGFVHGDGRLVDHINRDRLDCRRENLRESSPALNAQNRNAVSGFRGVCWDQRTQKWQATVKVAGRAHYLGQFADEANAAMAAANFRAMHMPHSEEARLA